MVIKHTDDDPRTLTTSREPVGVAPADGKGSAGDRALTDAWTVIIICWAIIAFLALSFRRYNV